MKHAVGKIELQFFYQFYICIGKLDYRKSCDCYSEEKHIVVLKMCAHQASMSDRRDGRRLTASGHSLHGLTDRANIKIGLAG